MMGWITDMLRPKYMLPVEVEHDDPAVRAAVARAWNTGKPVVATFDPNGNLTLKEIN